MRFLPAGDTALTVEFGSTISDDSLARVRRLDAALAAHAPDGVQEVVPTYRSLQIVYDPTVIGWQALEQAVQAVLEGPDKGAEARPARLWTVPVAYGGAHGIDLEPAAARLGLTPQALARAHAACDFTVAMIGFQPGFAYLAGLPEALHLSRQDSPRRETPAGSISIGGVQAAISSVAAPSAWHLLGRTPLRPFDLRRDPPFLFRSGDRVRFRPIDAAEFDVIAARVAAGDPGATPEEAPHAD